MIKTDKPKDIDKFITSSGTEKVENEKMVRYLLTMPEPLRRAIRHEAIEQGVNMSDYICSIIEKRDNLL